MADTTFLSKYEDIIKEELNIKEITEMGWENTFSKQIKPLGSKLSAKFGKDTGRIIQLWKEGKIKENSLGQVVVFDDNNERILEDGDYEIAYEGLEWDNIGIENDIIAKLDLTMTPELLQEWVAREISRFLNQMRKDAKFNVDDKITLTYSTKSDTLKAVLATFWEFLQDEALIKEIKAVETPTWDHIATFTSDNDEITFAVTK
jgi:isoleucyl-tRNA synthetase